MSTALDNVKRIYLEGIAGGKAREAVHACTGHRYTQHSTGVADGAEGFLSFFEPFLERNPVRDIQIRRIFQDGPWVFCHAYQSLNDGAAKWVTMDLFYTDLNGLILEHWDTIAPFVAQTASGMGSAGGTCIIDNMADTNENKSIVLEYTKQVRQQREFGAISRFVTATPTQHSPGIAAGRDALCDWHASDEAGQYQMLFSLVGQGDFVATYGKRHARGAEIAAFDLYRLQDGKIVEHWMNEEAIGPKDTWGNSGKF